MTTPLSADARKVLKWLTEGHDANDIAAALAEQAPGTDVPAVIGQAVDHLAAAGNLNRQVIVGWALESYRELYRRMVQVGDFANALRAVKGITDLLKAGEPAHKRRTVDLSDIEVGP